MHGLSYVHRKLYYLKRSRDEQRIPKPFMELENGRDGSVVEAEERPHMSRGLKWVLTVAGCVLVLVGSTGGPLLLRLYYLHGGQRRWLSSWLETGGWPLFLGPLFLSYFRRRRHAAEGGKACKLVFITRRLFLAYAGLGLLIGLIDFLYAYGLAFLPVSTSALLVSTQLVFIAAFAFVIVRQRFTPYSINAVMLLTVASVMLGLHGSSDWPEGETRAQYYLGFFLTLGVAALLGMVLTLIELTYQKAQQVITYTLVMEMQMVAGFFATVVSTVGMLVSHDFQAIPGEASNFGLGEVRYYVVLVWSAIFWQLNYIGLAIVIFCANTLLAGILTAVSIPITDVFGVILFNEKFNSEKGVSLVLSLWGLASYTYGEYRASKAAVPRANSAT